MLLVEGPSDKGALPILVGKVTAGSSVARALVVGSDLFQPQKLKVHIQFARQQHRTISKVLLCVDSECTPIEETQSRVTPLQEELQRDFPGVSIRYVVVDHALEGWLLADREALLQILGKNATLPHYASPDDECQPAKVLDRIFRRNKGYGYNKTRDAIRLAEEADVRRISQVSNTFQDFQRAICGP